MNICKNCNGEGGWDVAVQCSSESFSWISSGDYMDIGFKECFWCNGTGEITQSRIQEMLILKKLRK